MEDDLPQRLARAETNIENLKKSDDEIKTELKSHELSLHKHGRELQGITMASGAMKESLDVLNKVIENLPLKIAEAISPIRDVAQQTKEEFQKYKYMFWGGVTAFGLLGSTIVALLYQILGLKGVID